MQRLAKFDVSRQFSRPAARAAVQLAFGTACAVAMIALRLLIDSRLPDASPFALVYPSVVVATLYGHWRAGVLAGVVTFIFAWYYFLPMPFSFAFDDPSGLSRTALSAASAAVVLVFAETFRHLVFTAVEERDAEIAQRAMLMQELEHRTKNNFALVVSLLETQRRDETDPRVLSALELATARVHSFARSYGNLGEGLTNAGCVAMKPYLSEVIERFIEGAFREGIEVSIAIADCRLPREMAVAIALFANEALTNCVKYAFPDARGGRVEVTFAGNAQSWHLIVADDGVGQSAQGDRDEEKGLGSRLMYAFAERAKATFEVEATRSGRRVRLTSTGGRASPSWRVAWKNVLPAGKAAPRARPQVRSPREAASA